MDPHIHSPIFLHIAIANDLDEPTHTPAYPQEPPVEEGVAELCDTTLVNSNYDNLSFVVNIESHLEELHTAVTSDKTEISIHSSHLNSCVLQFNLGEGKYFLTAAI